MSDINCFYKGVFVLENMLNHLQEILAQPMSLFALLAMALFIVAFFYSRKIKLTTNMLVYTALMLALTIVLHQLRIYHMPQGGSVTLGSMLPLLFLSFRYGPGIGFLAGFLYGMINLLQDPFILHPVQVLFDYPLPYMVLGIAGFFPGRYLLGAILGVSVRFLCHFISGIVFFASYAPAGTSTSLYAFIFNASYLVPELLICLLLLKVLPVQRLLSYMKITRQ